MKKPSSEEIKRQREKIAEAYPVLDCGKKVIAGVGNTTERKGFDIFLQIAALIPECEFIWAGKKEITTMRQLRKTESIQFYFSWFT